MCARLKRAGYVIMLDDFTLAQRGSALLAVADMVRVGSGNTTPEDRANICREVSAAGVIAMAKEVHTAEEFDLALERGYAFLQGEFFSKPILRPGNEISANKANYLRVLNGVNKPELEYDELDELIKRDVAMTYALLRFVNSAWYGVRTEIRSIRHALILLGPKEVRTWASLLVLKSLGTDKPNELFRRSLSRAKVAEQVAPLIGMEAMSSELFLMGMFSVIDALTDISMAKILEELPLAEPVAQALLAGEGDYGPLYRGILAYESADWETFSACAAEMELDEPIMPELFTMALKWADEVLELI